MPTHSEVIETLTAQNENLRRALCVVGAHFSGEPGYTRVRAEVAVGDALEGSSVDAGEMNEDTALVGGLREALDIATRAHHDARVERDRLRAALGVAESELSRIVNGVWIARNSVPSMLHWVQRVRDSVRAALAGGSG